MHLAVFMKLTSDLCYDKGIKGHFGTPLLSSIATLGSFVKWIL